MADEPHVIRGINWRETFPFTNIFRAFRVAVHPTKLILALLGLLALYFGGWALDGLWTSDARGVRMAIPERNDAGVVRTKEVDELHCYDAFVTATPAERGNATFDQGREMGRAAIQSQYADLLTKYEVAEKDKPLTAEQAKAAAKAGSYHSALEDKITAKQEKDGKALEDKHDREVKWAEKGILDKGRQIWADAQAKIDDAEAAKKVAEQQRAALPGNATDDQKKQADKTVEDKTRDAAKALDENDKKRKGDIDTEIKAADTAFGNLKSEEKDKAQTARKEDVKKLDAAYRKDRAGLYAGCLTDYKAAGLIRGEPLSKLFFNYEAEQVNGVVKGVLGGNWLGGFVSPATVAVPNGVVRCTINFFTVAPGWAMHYHTFYFILFAILFIVVWAIFGGAIARVSAVHVAREEKLSVKQALRFSAGKFLSFLFAPIIPLAIVLVVGLVVALGGLLTNIPFIGPILVGVLFFLALAAGFVMTLVLLGTVGGFNLMYPTIAVEGSDSFDAISRAFSYVYARPWRMLFYTAVAVIYGALCYLFVRAFVYLTLVLTHYFAGLWVFRDADNTQNLWQVMWPQPSDLWSFPFSVNHSMLGLGQSWGASCVAIWVYVVIAMMGAFLISFYFSANTIIYYLMRREVDATEMDDVYLEQPEEEFAESGAATVATTVPATAPSAPAPAASPETPPAASPAPAPSETPAPVAPAEPAPAAPSEPAPPPAEPTPPASGESPETKPNP